MLQYNALPDESRLPEGENPIERKQLFLTVSVNNFQLNDNFNVAGVGHINGGGDDDIAAGMGLQNSAILQAQINQIDRAIAAYAEETRTQFEAIHAQMAQFQRAVASNFNRLNRHPLRMLQAAAAGDAPAPVVQAPIVRGPEQRQPDVDQNADLCPTPRTLHELWMEWQSGIAGRKPARLFTARERGRRKSTFCRRKAFWEVVQLMTRRGTTSDEACDQIYQAYGPQLSVTQILDAMIVDRRNNTSPFRDI
jgi:Transcriptional activator of glycolytic enzymes